MAKTSTIRKPADADSFVGGAAAKAALVRTTIDLDATQHRALKIRALNDGVGIADLFRGWVAAYLDGELSAPGKEAEPALPLLPPAEKPKAKAKNRTPRAKAAA